jgi:predicted Zn-dependent protease
VFTTLERVSATEAQGRVPGWLSTHPTPADRRTRIAQQIQTLPQPVGGTIDREEYLARLEGVVFGPNPREGFFEQNVFYHPDLRFQFEFPRGWQTSNQKQAVSAMSPQRDAVVVVTMAGRNSADAAAREFFSQQGIERGQSWRGDINGLPAVAHSFVAATEQGMLQGVAAFVELGGRVYQILGYAPASRWRSAEAAVTRSINSFDRVTDRRVLDVQPRRVRIVEVPRGMTVAEFYERYPSTVNLQTVANINGVTPGERLPAGAAKRVVGGSSA